VNTAALLEALNELANRAPQEITRLVMSS
jgi:hypothetical protein